MVDRQYDISHIFFSNDEEVEVKQIDSHYDPIIIRIGITELHFPSVEKYQEFVDIINKADIK